MGPNEELLGVSVVPELCDPVVSVRELDFDLLALVDLQHCFYAI
jgi:hypothetical protein